MPAALQERCVARLVERTAPIDESFEDNVLVLGEQCLERGRGFRGRLGVGWSQLPHQRLADDDRPGNNVPQPLPRFEKITLSIPTA